MELAEIVLERGGPTYSFPRARAPGRGERPELGDGLAVAPGSTLVGAVFPGQSLSDTTSANTSLAGDDIWTAVLKLTGNPIKALNRYIEQALAAGLGVRAECLLAYHDGSTRPPLEPLDERGLRGLTCHAIGATPDDGTPPEELTIELTRSAEGAPYDDSILVRFARLPAGTPPPVLPPAWLVGFPDVWSERVPAPPEPPRLPKVGEPIREVDPVAARPIDVVEGTRLIAPSALPCASRGGFDAVLEVTDDIDAVLDAYADQLRNIGMAHDGRVPQPGRDDRRRRGRTGNYGAVALHGADAEPAYLHLWFCPTS